VTTQDPVARLRDAINSAVDQVAHAYGAHAARLMGAKERYDPEHVFTATPLPDGQLADPQG